MKVRQVFFWLHLSAGTCAGIVIFIMSVTGVLLTYERQMAEWADLRAYRIVRPHDGAERLAVEDVLERVQQQEPKAQLASVTVRAGDAPITVALGPRTLFVNPYDGTIMGEGAPGVRAFFRRVRDWHRWLGVNGEGRNGARAITGASNLVFLFIVCSGFYLWWPRTWTWRQVRSVIWFRGNLRARQRDFNWHNTAGFWCCVPLVIVVASATVISYRWSSDLVYRVAGEEPPRAAPPAAAAGARGGGVRTEGIDDLLQRGQRQVPDWRTLSVRIPRADDKTATLTIDQGSGGEPHKRSSMVLDFRSGKQEWEPFSAQSDGRRWRSLLRFAHTGEAGGLVGQTVAGIASAGGALLVWTGISLAIRRFLSWRRARPRVADERAA